MPGSINPHIFVRLSVAVVYPQLFPIVSYLEQT